MYMALDAWILSSPLFFVLSQAKYTWVVKTWSKTGVQNQAKH